MVTPQGFNALLKIVEEPPEHIKFIFATTEPDKVIGTIRSRTHHYPFRLVPPERLQGVPRGALRARGRRRSAPGVLPLVVRAGGGSVRDSLSVLDQLIAGAGADGLDYERPSRCSATPTPRCWTTSSRRCRAGDGAAVFRVVDRVDRVRPRPAPLRRGPAGAAARPDHRRGRAGRRARRAARHAGRPARPDARRRRAGSAPPSCPARPTSPTPR